jgi:type II secretory pathway pseudopilin PulG
MRDALFRVGQGYRACRCDCRRGCGLSRARARARACACTCTCAGASRHRTPRRRGAPGGYTYLALLILLAIISIAAAASAELGAIYQRRMAEKELLAVGAQFQRALQSYSSSTPIGQPTQPRTLEELLRDPRYPNVVRHLRRVYDDPMTGKADWVLVMSPDGQTIVGIHSASHAHPIQIAHFPAAFQGFANKKSYTDWVFVARFPALTQGQRPPDGPVLNGDAPGSVNGGSVPFGASQPGGMSSSDGSSFGGGSLNNGSSNGGAFGGGSFNNGSSNGGAFGGGTFNNGSSNGGAFGGNSPFGGGSSSGFSPGRQSSGGASFNSSPFGGGPASQ